MKRFLLLPFLAMFVLFSQVAVAQVTTASMVGQIKGPSSEELIGANITVLHVPSGSLYGNSSDPSGFYRIPNMRVGGPYKVTVSYTGYEDFVRENVYLSLGQTYSLYVTLQETVMDLSTVEVIGLRNDVFDGNKTGQSTVVDERLMTDVPTISRSIADYARFNPLASLSEGNDGFAVSLAGQNNRFNAIYIDGAVNNDVFGLAGSGTNGGQTGVSPISIDAVEQFNVDVAPFDVRQSGFAGGAINAVTRSGTNDFKGSAYYFFRNEGLAGVTPTDNEAITPAKLPDFSANTYGFRLGGPIMKDKVFFFVNAELQRDNTPQPFNFADYDGDATEAQLEALRSKVSNDYGYDLGTYTANESFLNSNKILAKLDFNLNAKHKLSLRHSYTNAENLEARSSSSRSINFQNGSEYFISNTHSTALELSSLLNNTMSNKLTVTGTFVRDDRDPLGNPFPSVDLGDGDNGTINFGAERFSTANLLNQDVITINNDFNVYKGKHNLLFGVNLNFFKAGNLFIRENYGRFRWFDTDEKSGLQAFIDGDNASRLDASFSQVDNIVGDESQAIAEFSTATFGLYAQDEIQVSEKFKLTAGLRLDIDSWPDEQPINTEFNTETIPVLETNGYDLLGARTGSFISTQFRLSPRVGFNYDLKGDRTSQLRGGIGIFNSRAPLVWPGGAYNNYGFNVGGGRLTDVPFTADVNNLPLQAELNNLTPSGQIDLFAEDFKLPQVFKADLAFDQKLGAGIIGTIEGLFTKNVNAVAYQNLNIAPSTENFNGGADTRPLFNGDILSDYSYIMLGQNTSKGYAYNFAVSLSKPFTNGFAANLSYSYGDSYTTFDGGSSQNSSQWRGYFSPLQAGSFTNGRNVEGDAQRSNFAAGHRIFGQVSYEIDYLSFGKSKLSLNFNGETGDYFSYVVGARNFNFVDDDGFDFNELAFVPAAQGDIKLVDIVDDGVVVATAAQQWDALDAYISSVPGLDARRGDYSERNTDKLPFEFGMDMRFLQDFYIETGKGKRNTLQLSFDIFNFTNLINADWGRRRFMPFSTYSLVNLEDVDDGTFTVNEDLLDPNVEIWDGNIDDSGFRSSRWQMQIGLRYIFE